MIGADSFSRSYSEAREKFQEAVAAAGGRAESFKHPCFGPGGEELAADAAWFGPSDASRVLVLISGTHGVEGYCGSGAQIDWLRREEFKLLPADTGVLMIHAINPTGSHGRAGSMKTTLTSIGIGLIFRRLCRQIRVTSNSRKSSVPRNGRRRRGKQRPATWPRGKRRGGQGRPSFGRP